MRKLMTLTVIAVAFSLSGGTNSAQAHLVAKPKKDTAAARLASQTENLKHARYVCRHGGGEHKRWSCHAVSWLTRERNETQHHIYTRSSDWRAYLLRLVGPSTYRFCALPLIGRESGGVVTKWNYGGSGAYGLGQALPASKMAPYGSDYMTNGVTQIKWMHVYVQRYGGWCGANSFQMRNNYY